MTSSFRDCWLDIHVLELTDQKLVAKIMVCIMPQQEQLAINSHTWQDSLQTDSCMLLSINTPSFRRQILTQTWLSSHPPSYCTQGL
jgi:hypothetical protein